MAGNGSKIFRTSLGGFEWTHRISCEFGLALWKEDSLMLVKLKKSTQSNFFVEEKIITVAWRDIHLFVASQSGAILLRSGCEWEEVARCDGLIQKLFPFEQTVGSLFENDQFRIFSLKGRELFSAAKVGGVALSHCGKRAALWFKFEKFALEVSQDGEELHKVDLNCLGARCVPNGLLGWHPIGEAFLVDERNVLRQLDFTVCVLQVEVANDGSIALIRTGEQQIWIVDLHSGSRELLLDRKVAGVKFLRKCSLSPCAHHILVITGDFLRNETREYFVINRR